MIINTFGEFIAWTQARHAKSKVALFRGQPVQGNLLPNIARKNPTYDSTHLERIMLDQFKLMGASMLMNVDKNLLELLVVAQHYGLKTRLLDWTSNPLAALYFACSDTTKGDVFVYALEADDLIASDVYEKDPLVTPRTRVFQPPLNNPRIIAQQGWFTLHSFSSKSGKFVALERNVDTKDFLAEVKISEESRPELLESLRRHGTASHSLFPDLGGLSDYLNGYHLVA